MGDKTLPQTRWWFFLFGLLLPPTGLFGSIFSRALIWLPNLWLSPFFLFVPCLIGIIAFNWKSERLDLYTGRFIAGFIIGYLLSYSWLFFLFFGPGDFHD